MSEPLPHSAIYFGDSRDHWWHADQLELFARRLDLGRRRRALDVGCGYGHWGRALLPLLAPDVDRKWPGRALLKDNAPN